MTTENFVSSSGDGQVYATLQPTYATARNTSSGFDITTAQLKVGQQAQFEFVGQVYSAWRLFLKFDTSALTSSANITSVKLGLTAQADNSYANFDVQIVKQDWSSQDPIASGTREAAYDGCLSGTADDSIWRNTSGMSLNTPYESGELDISYINKTGNTYYSLRSSRDYSGTPEAGDTESTVTIYMSEAGTSTYRPYLAIEYTLNYMRIMMKIHS